MIGTLCLRLRIPREPEREKKCQTTAFPVRRYSSSVTWQWVLLSHWSAPKQAPPTSSQLSRSNLWWGGFVQLLVECRSWDREWDKRWLPASPQDPLAHQALGQWVSWEGPGNRLKAVSAHWPWLRPWWQPWMSPPSSPLWPNSSESAGHNLWDLPPPSLCGLRSLRASWAGHLAPSVMTVG